MLYEDGVNSMKYDGMIKLGDVHYQTELNLSFSGSD